MPGAAVRWVQVDSASQVAPSGDTAGLKAEETAGRRPNEVSTHGPGRATMDDSQRRRAGLPLIHALDGLDVSTPHGDGGDPSEVRVRE